MARMPRLVVPGFPHYVTQRGNQRQKTFFNVDDYSAYSEVIANSKWIAGCEIWKKSGDSLPISDINPSFRTT